MSNPHSSHDAHHPRPPRFDQDQTPPKQGGGWPWWAKVLLVLFVVGFIGAFPLVILILGLVGLVIGGLGATGKISWSFSSKLIASRGRSVPGWAQQWGDFAFASLLIVVSIFGFVLNAQVEKDRARKESERQAAKVAEQNELKRLEAERLAEQDRQQRAEDEREQRLLSELPSIEKSFKDSQLKLAEYIESGDYIEGLTFADSIEENAEPYHDVEWPASLIEAEASFDALHVRVAELAEVEATVVHAEGLVKQAAEKVAAKQWVDADAMYLAAITESELVQNDAPDSLKGRMGEVTKAATESRARIKTNVETKLREQQAELSKQKAELSKQQAELSKQKTELSKQQAELQKQQSKQPEVIYIDRVQTTRSRSYRRNRGPGRGK